MPQSYQKTGYLNADFKLFHIIDQSKRSFEYHYHDFHKLLIFLSGNVSYIVEGKQYALEPKDILMVRAGEIHKPVIHDTSDYERIIIYISPLFFEKATAEGTDLFRCFDPKRSEVLSFFRFPDLYGSRLEKLFGELKESVHGEAYASSLYQKIKFTELLIVLNRLSDREEVLPAQAITANPAALNILKYINDHLQQEDLSVDSIASAAFLNRSYLMHLFKAETGYTVGKYISEKRLFLARSMIESGTSITDACFQCGFKNYSAFYYAYKKKYGSSPTREEKAYFPEKSSE